MKHLLNFFVYYDFHNDQLIQVVENLFSENPTYTIYYSHNPIVTTVNPYDFGLIFIGDY